MSNRDVKYLSKDFNSFLSNIQTFAKSYFPQSFRDFSAASSGEMLIELLAYSSDILTFYLNRTTQEVFLDSAVQKQSVISIARSLGYKPPKRACSLVEQTVYIQVPATYDTGIALPNFQYAPVFKRGSSFLSQNGTIYESLYDIDFTKATGSEDFVPSQINSTTSQVEWFSLRKSTVAVSAQTKQKTFPVSDFVRYRKLVVDDSESIDVFDVLDEQGNKWYEVDYLVQDTVFEASTNTNYDNSLVPYVMKLKKVPRRFVTEFDYNAGYINLVFGSGKQDLDDSELIPNISEVSLPLYGKSYFSDFSIDPQNFLNTKTLGLSPYNTVLNVYYRAGGGASSVVKAGEISKIDKGIYEFKYTNLDATIQNRVVNSLATSNENPSIGGRDELSIFEIKQNAKAFFAAQSRCVTREDYQVRIMSMPTIFGSFCKANVKKSCLSPNLVEIVVLSFDENKNFSAPSDTLIRNAKIYLQKYASLTDNVYIRPASIVTFSINYVVVCEESANRNSTLSLCTSLLIDRFDKDNMQVNSPIVKSEIIKILQGATGIYSVSKLDFFFSDSSVKEENGIFYAPNNDSIFEIENFSNDIVGAVI